MSENHSKRATEIKCIAIALLTAAVGYAGGAAATLHDRGSGLIYDDVLNITWTQDANLPGSSGLTWSQANAWAANLVFGGYADWRLPTSLNQDGTGPCIGFNCSNSEMGHMFYNNLDGNLGDNKTGNQPAAGGVTLNNIQLVYWSGTEFNSNPNEAWLFGFEAGIQNRDVKGLGFSAWAVRPGDVAAAAPEPASLLLIGAGMLGLGWSRRRGRRR